LVEVADHFDKALAGLTEAHEMVYKALEPVLRPLGSVAADLSPQSPVVEEPVDAPLISRLMEAVNRIERLSGRLIDLETRIAILPS